MRWFLGMLSIGNRMMIAMPGPKSRRSVWKRIPFGVRWHQLIAGTSALRIAMRSQLCVVSVNVRAGARAVTTKSANIPRTHFIVQHPGSPTQIDRHVQPIELRRVDKRPALLVEDRHLDGVRLAVALVV